MGTPSTATISFSSGNHQDTGCVTAQSGECPPGRSPASPHRVSVPSTLLGSTPDCHCVAPGRQHALRLGACPHTGDLGSSSLPSKCKPTQDLQPPSLLGEPGAPASHNRESSASAWITGVPPEAPGFLLVSLQELIENGVFRTWGAVYELGHQGGPTAAPPASTKGRSRVEGDLLKSPGPLKDPAGVRPSHLQRPGDTDTRALPKFTVPV